MGGKESQYQNASVPDSVPIVVTPESLDWNTLEGMVLLLRKLFFPKNIEYQYPGFKTAELAPIYNVKSYSSAQENHYVTQVGQNWNQLLTELEAWYSFGRALEAERV